MRKPSLSRTINYEDLDDTARVIAGEVAGKEVQSIELDGDLSGLDLIIKFSDGKSLMIDVSYIYGWEMTD
jgi:hypothetical protein